MRVIGVDVSAEMLRLGREKVKRRHLERQVSFILADADALPFKDNGVDCLVNAFFLRHLPDLSAAFAEFHRVLSDGGRIISLELSQNPAPGFRAFFRPWFRLFVPMIGGWISGNRQAYEYLPHSLDVFPGAEGLLELMRGAGFRADYEEFALGMVAISRGVR
jgi:demethylmenaquinone methyltransferase/2-methoxy-6-polyprenyl-1,4-benzoquinol methylase